MNSPEIQLDQKLNSEPALDAGFVFADKVRGADLWELGQRELASVALSDSERLRLVEGSKSPTKEIDWDLLRESTEKHQASQLERHNWREKFSAGDQPSYNLSLLDDFKRQRTNLETPGTKTVVERRTWTGFDEFRIRTEVDTRQKVHAPEGKRKSVELTRRGATKIADSCAYVAMERGGYSTFVTLTFTDEQRGRIANGEVTIQKEVSRALDGFKKVYARGMKREGVEGNNDEFDYCWVVEIPKNAAGEDNPHVHLLMRWRVKRNQFEAWAARLEKLWGHGFAHIEKIKDPIQASAYMAKAAGYLTKGQDASQGEVRGNRYGIAESSRAPGWEKFSEAQMHIMGQLIWDIYDHMTEQYGELYQKRKELNQQREELLELQKGAKEIGDQVGMMKAKNKRTGIGKALAAVRDQIKKIPARCNKYQLVIQGAKNFHDFCHWATGKAEKVGIDRPEWLPEKCADTFYIPGRKPNSKDSKDVHDLRKSIELAREARFFRYQKKHAASDSWLALMGKKFDEYRQSAVDGWSEYFSLGWRPLDLCQ